MRTATIVGGLLSAGALMAGWGVVAADDPPSETTTAVATSDLVTGVDAALEPAEVVAFFDARVDAHPTSALDRTQLGMALLDQARAEADLDLYAAAEQTLMEAIDLNSEHAPAKLALGRALHAQHSFVDAQVLAVERLADVADDPAALALLGDTQLELGSPLDALESYRQLEALERTAPVVSRIARVQFALGRPEVAAELASEALEIASTYDLGADDEAFYHFQLGHFRFAIGEVDAAIEALESARSIAPGHPGATEKLAFVLASVGETTAAEALYVELLESGAAPDLHGSYADLLAARGDEQGAAEQEALGFELAAETAGAYPAERRHLVAFYQTRDAAHAVELAEEDLLVRQDWAAYDTLAWALALDGQWERAAEVITPALEQGVQDAAMLYHAAEIHAAVGDDTAAAELVGRALQINSMFHPFDAAAAAELADRLEVR